MSSPTDPPQSSRSATNRWFSEPVARQLTWPAVIVATLVVVCNSWLGDDSYITFRTVDNLLHGYGPTWNTAERVQSYTHPLWFVIVTALASVMRSVYAAAMSASWGLALLTFYCFAFRVAASRIAAISGLILLFCSKSFVHYSTSGLENVVTHALIVLFWIIERGTSSRSSIRRNMLALGLLTSLLALNRLDTLLLVAPLLFTLIVRAIRERTIGTLALAALGFLPFVAWEVFSVVYYGFPVPNTAYAKLSTGISAFAYAKQGIIYLVDSAHFDPLLVLVIPGGMLVAVFCQELRPLLPYAIGAGLYVLYTVKVGGDFMAGRFLSGPYLVAVLILSRIKLEGPTASGRVRLVTLTSVAATALGCMNVNATLLPVRTRKEVRYHGVRADERSWWGPATSLGNLLHGHIPNDPTAVAGRQARAAGWHVSTQGVVGFFGYEAGPNVHILDRFALCDPLLARLPANQQWMIGHFSRDVPVGYIPTLATGANRLEHKALATYYDELTKVTRGSLWTKARWTAIWRLNTGDFDHLLAIYLADTKREVQSQ